METRINIEIENFERLRMDKEEDMNNFYCSKCVY